MLATYKPKGFTRLDFIFVYSPKHNHSLPTDSLKGALAEGNLRVPQLLVHKADSIKKY